LLRISNTGIHITHTRVEFGRKAYNQAMSPASYQTFARSRVRASKEPVIRLLKVVPTF